MPNKTTLIVRNVDKRIFKEFKLKAAKGGTTIGKAINMAMLNWVKQESKKPKISIIHLRPASYKHKKTSKEIDKELYGD